MYQLTPEEHEAAFQREVEAFERLKPSFLALYSEKYVAIYQGQVVAVGDARLALAQEVRAQFGHIPCYIEQVSLKSPRVIRMPSIYVTRI